MTPWPASAPQAPPFRGGELHSTSFGEYPHSGRSKLDLTDTVNSGQYFLLVLLVFENLASIQHFNP